MAPLIAVTDHAVERYRQRVRGSLDARTEVTARVGSAWAAGDVSREPPPGAAAQRGSVYVRDGRLVFVCLEDRPRGEPSCHRGRRARTRRAAAVHGGAQAALRA